MNKANHLEDIDPRRKKTYKLCDDDFNIEKTHYGQKTSASAHNHIHTQTKEETEIRTRHRTIIHKRLIVASSIRLADSTNATRYSCAHTLIHLAELWLYTCRANGVAIATSACFREVAM